MATTRVFRSGTSQAVQLPKGFRLKGNEVEIFRQGDEIVLREKGKGRARAFEILASLPDDFSPEGRRDTPAPGARLARLTVRRRKPSIRFEIRA